MTVVNIATSDVVIPTTSDSVNEYYVAVDTNYAYSQIYCSKLHCHITCDVTSGCYGMEVYETANTNTINITCTKSRACFGSTIHADQVKKIHITCKSTASVRNEGACAHLLLQARNSVSVNMMCTRLDSTTTTNYGFACADANIHLEYAGHATIIADAYYSLIGGNIYAYNMTNGLNITCGYQSCFTMSVYADYMEG
eukprot:206083_1